MGFKSISNLSRSAHGVVATATRDEGPNNGVKIFTSSYIPTLVFKEMYIMEFALELALEFVLEFALEFVLACVLELVLKFVLEFAPEKKVCVFSM